MLGDLLIAGGLLGLSVGIGWLVHETRRQRLLARSLQSQTNAIQVLREHRMESHALLREANLAMERAVQSVRAGVR